MNIDDIKPGKVYRGKSGRLRYVEMVNIQHPMGFKRSILSQEVKTAIGRFYPTRDSVWWNLDKFADWAVEEYTAN
jgi:hypothetical protein